MALRYYDFKCVKCGTVKEILTTGGMEVHECDQCGSIMQKQLCAPKGFQFKGKGSYATDYEGKNYG